MLPTVCQGQGRNICIAVETLWLACSGTCQHSFIQENVYSVTTNVNGSVFADFLRCLLHILLPFDGYNRRSVVVIDNASIHHVEATPLQVMSIHKTREFVPLILR